MNCGVVKSVDPFWPEIIKNCLNKLWEIFHEQNHGRIKDKLAYEKQLAKLMKEKDHLCNEYHKLGEINLYKQLAGLLGKIFSMVNLFLVVHSTQDIAENANHSIRFFRP